MAPNESPGKTERKTEHSSSLKTTTSISNPSIKHPIKASERILTPEALRFLKELHLKFNPLRRTLLEQRALLSKTPQQRLRFLEETRAIRESEWKVAPPPSNLEDRRVEITGPVDRKMMINALNSGANVFMADFEDSLSPTWKNILEGQVHVLEAHKGSLSYESPEGKKYVLSPNAAVLFVRPRGWHLPEAHLQLEGEAFSGALVDFGLSLFHHHLLKSPRNQPYYYLPKMESYLEARLWAQVFDWSEKTLGLPRNTIRATALIETLPAAFQMHEILFELRDYLVGLNAGRWDYIFSFIKSFCDDSTKILPDRSQITMEVPFMRSYAESIVATCHARGAHAMGGMSAFVPSRKDPLVNQKAFQKVREDKLREAKLGFDGTWVAHPDLVSVARDAFTEIIGAKRNQKDLTKPHFVISERALLQPKIEDGMVTEAGIRNNIQVSLIYLNHWLEGTGASAIHFLMEDVATAEISRAQLWQWIKHKAPLSQSKHAAITQELFEQILKEEVLALEKSPQKLTSLTKARTLLRNLVLSKDFEPFLTLPAYKLLVENDERSPS